MSDLLPLFPLPNVVLFPGVSLPLHIFESRYRQMIADALEGDRLIGMVLLRPGWDHDYDGRPPIYETGCTGLITHVEELPDGRYNIVLRGLERFRIVEEDHALSYRRALVTPRLEDDMSAVERTTLKGHRTRLEGLLAPALDKARHHTEGQADVNDESAGAYARAAAGLSDVDLVNALSQYLSLEPLEKLALLEHDSVPARAASLVELLEMKILIARTPGMSGVFH
jgi:Lon protease-like protein